MQVLVHSFAVAMIVLFAAAAQGTVLYRINVGGPEIASIDAGPLWAEDSSASPDPHRVSGGENFYDTTSGSSTGPVGSGPAGVPLALFDTERWDPATDDEMQWEFIVGAGAIQVNLYFAEIYNGITAAGQRVIDVAVEGVVPAAFDDIDPYALGGNAASVGVVVSHTLIVGDGTLDIDFSHVIENPALKGIEIVAVPEPASAALLVSGLALLAARARRRA